MPYFPRWTCSKADSVPGRRRAAACRGGVRASPIQSREGVEGGRRLRLHRVMVRMQVAYGRGGIGVVDWREFNDPNSVRVWTGGPQGRREECGRQSMGLDGEL